MKCPNSKCKGGKRITTKRTYDEGSRMRREKHCPKCKEKFTTFELTEKDYNKLIADYEARIETLSRSLHESRNRHDHLTGTVLSLMQQVGIEPKSNGKAKGKGKPAKRICTDCGDEFNGTGDLCRDCLGPLDIEA